MQMQYELSSVSECWQKYRCIVRSDDGTLFADGLVAFLAEKLERCSMKWAVFIIFIHDLNIIDGWVIIEVDKLRQRYERNEIY